MSRPEPLAPARMAALDDRGRIAAALRADLPCTDERSVSWPAIRRDSCEGRRMP